MRTRRWLMACATVATFLATPAQALMFTIEADDYAAGTNISNLFEGVTLSRYSHAASDPGAPTYSPVYTQASTGGVPPTTGTMFLGSYLDGRAAAHCYTTSLCSSFSTPFLYRANDFSALMIQFDRPINFFEVSAFFIQDDASIFAYDSNRQLVGQCYALGICTGAGSVTSFQTSPWGYATYRIGGLSAEPFFQTLIVGGGFPETAVNIDTIRYAGVPEPSPLLLLGVGLCTFVVLTQRRFIIHSSF